MQLTSRFGKFLCRQLKTHRNGSMEANRSIRFPWKRKSILLKTHWCGQGLIQHRESYLGDKYGVDNRIVLKVLQNLHSFTLRSWPVNKRSKSRDISQYIKAWIRHLEITDMNHITYFFNFSAYFLRANTLSENTMTLSFRLKKEKYITKFAGLKRQTFLGWRFYNTLDYKPLLSVSYLSW